MRTLLRSAGFVGCLAIATSVVLAQSPPQPAASFDLRQSIPFDAAVRTGTLPNGLRYFIRHNDRPAARLTLRLVVKAGSLYEADDQLGLAHLIEHMAFNGSEHFKPGELVSYFDSIGASLGPHVNAYTSFDETVYMFELPTDRPEVVAKGLTALADFAGGLSLTPAEVDKERGVVIEEWRGRLGAQSRIRDKQIPILFYKSRYADRITIGKPEIIRNAPVERLRSFYDMWYRPDRMAVIAVGDVNVDDIEKSIRDTFSAQKARGPAAPEPDHAVPLPEELLVSAIGDSEVAQSSVQITSKYPRGGERLVGDYCRQLVVSLFARMFDDRLSELARKPDAKFLSASVGEGSLNREVSLFSLSARAQDGRIEAALSAVAIEAQRVQQYGFLDSELERAKQQLLASYQRAYSERDKTESGSFAQEYLNYFLEDEPSPGIDYEYRLVQALLPGMTLKDIAAETAIRLPGSSRVILAVSPEKATITVPTETSLQAALTSAKTVAVTPWTDTASNRALLEKKPAPGTVVSRRELPELGVTVVKFSNGLEAWLKPTPFKNDQVLFTMYATGGASLASAAEFTNATTAVSYIGLSGAGGLGAIELRKLLAGKLVTSSPFISLSTHGISGSAAPADLETALQLCYQQFTAPGDDPEAFALLKRQLEQAAANRGQSPGQVFSERADQVNTSNHFVSQPLTTEVIATLDRAKMLAFYRARFANAADFTLFMVGAFKEDTAIPLLAQYAGSLPSTGQRTSAFKDLGIHFPAAVEKANVAKGREPRSNALVSFFADPDPDPSEQELIIATTNVLQTRLRDVLREELGQTYTISVDLSQSLPQRGDGHVEVNFGAAPENIKTMTDRVIQEIQRLQQNGPPLDLTANAKESARRTYETSLKENAYWLRRLQTVHQLGQDPAIILTRPARIEAITPERIQQAFKKYFPMDRYTIVTLMPETASGN